MISVEDKVGWAGGGLSLRSLRPRLALMQIAILLAILATLLSAQSASRIGDPLSVELRLLGVFATMSAIVLLAACRAQALVGDYRRGLASPAIILEQMNRSQEKHLWGWLVGCALILWPLNWPGVFLALRGVAGLHVWDYGLLVSPILLPLCLSWAAFYDADRLFQSAPHHLSRGEFVSLHLRHLVMPAASPLVVVLVLHDLGSWWPLSWRHELLSAAGHVAILSVGVVVFPLVLNRIWGTQSLPAGPLRDTLQRILTDAGVAVRDIRLWPSGNRAVNALVTGIWGRWRYVLLSDGAIGRLTPAQVAAVFAHEVAHVRRRHLGRLMVISLAVVTSVYVIDRFAAREFAGFLVSLPFFLGRTALLSGLIVTALLVVSRYSWLLEHQADLDASCQIAQWPETFAPDGAAEEGELATGFASAATPLERRRQACRLMQATLHALALNCERQRNGWWHPSIQARQDVLCQGISDPDVLASISCRLRNWEIAVVAVAAILAFSLA